MTSTEIIGAALAFAMIATIVIVVTLFMNPDALKNFLYPPPSTSRLGLATRCPGFGVLVAATGLIVFTLGGGDAATLATFAVSGVLSALALYYVNARDNKR